MGDTGMRGSSVTFCGHKLYFFVLKNIRALYNLQAYHFISLLLAICFVCFQQNRASPKYPSSFTKISTKWYYYYFFFTENWSCLSSQPSARCFPDPRRLQNPKVLSLPEFNRHIPSSGFASLPFTFDQDQSYPSVVLHDGVDTLFEQWPS